MSEKLIECVLGSDYDCMKFRIELSDMIYRLTKYPSHIFSVETLNQIYYSENSYYRIVFHGFREYYINIHGEQTMLEIYNFMDGFIKSKIREKKIQEVLS